MNEDPRLLGWREWVLFPELGLPTIKAKVDTGAKTTCLHAFELESFDKDGEPWLNFKVHPVQNNNDIVANCSAPVADRRNVTDSGGHTEERFVIKSPIVIGNWREDVEITLTARDNMKFRVLLGRNAMKLGGFSVNPSRSWLQKKPQ
jgi:hypothetical protein